MKMFRKNHVMQRLSKSFNVGSFTRNFFSTQICGYTVLNKLTV